MNINDSKILECLGNKYKVDTEQGKVYRYRANKGKYIELSKSITGGYEQVKLFSGRYTGLKVNAYIHRIIYLYAHSSINGVIDHINKDRADNRLINLEDVTQVENVKRSPKKVTPKYKTIRAKEIKQIKALLSNGVNPTQISKHLDLNRCSVAYISKKILNNEPLKYS